MNNLILQAQQGDEASMLALLKQYTPLLKKLGHHYLPQYPEEESLDIARLAFLEATPKCCDLNHYPGYVKQAVTYALWQEARRYYGRTDKEAPSDEETLELFEDKSAPSEEQLCLELSLHQELKRLTAAEQRDLHLRFATNLGVKEAAHKCGLSERGYRKRIAKILAILRQRLV